MSPDSINDDLEFEKEIENFSKEGQFLARHMRKIDQRCGPCLKPIEERLTILESQKGAVSLGTLIPALPRWTYPIVFVGALLSGLALPFIILTYLLLEAKGILPKFW